jgi:hypothetical protein
VLAKYEYDTANGVSYSALRIRIVFVVYRIHIFAPEYEYILNIFKYILATPCTEKLKYALDVCERDEITSRLPPAVFKGRISPYLEGWQRSTSTSLRFDDTERFNVWELADPNRSNSWNYI